MNRAYAIIYPFVWLFMRIFHPWRTVGAENIPEGAAVFCGNHTTIGDPLYVVCAMTRKRQIHVMAKEEVMHWPVVGWVLKKAGIFGVKRGKADMSAVKEALRVLKNGERLLLFPEGTRIRNGMVSEAHTGAALFATHTGAPLVPVYITPKKRLFRKTTVVFGQPFHPEFEGRKPSSAELQRIADELMERVRALEDQAG